MKAEHLQVEYLTNPTGIDIAEPRFYWHCAGGSKQTAYRIKVYKKYIGKSGVVQEIPMWDSGKTVSPSMAHIRYAGMRLQSRDILRWTVVLWDEKDAPGETEEGWFEMGLLSHADWQGSWISGDYIPQKNIRYPVDYFRKTFQIRMGVEIVKARLYMTACGIYEAELNGKRTGEMVLAPGCTDYRRRLQYQTYDVTGLLDVRKTEQVLTVSLADGWFRGSVGAFGPTNIYGRRTSFLCQMEIFYADGTKDEVLSDGTFEWSNDGPIRFADLKDGEIVDARHFPSYQGKARMVQESRKLAASNNVFPKEQESLDAKLLITPSGKKVLDFGQNIAGFVEFRLRGKKGQKVTLLMGEILDENGEFTQKNFQLAKPCKEFSKIQEIMLIMQMGNRMKNTQMTPMQKITFTCSGGQDYYKTRFAVFGFQYIFIDAEMEIDEADFHAIAVYSDLEQTGDFECSEEKVNRLYQNTVWSMKGNFLDIPTDCPTRERLGWTGDAQVFFDTGAYMMNIAPFFRKWMEDMVDGMLPNNVVPSVVPYVGFDLMYNNTAVSVGWADAAVYLPYRYWKRYQDTDILRTFYDRMMRPYAMFLLDNMGHVEKKEAKANPYNKYVYEKGRHLGEWLEPEEFNDKVGPSSKLRQVEVSTAYCHYTMGKMKEVAAELGREEDRELFAEYEQGTAKAYQYLFLKEGAYDTDRQAKLVRPIALGLAEEELKEKLQKRLVQAVVNRNYRIGTGFLSTPFVLSVLTDAGRSDLAYKMLENEEAPGWLYEINQGATTIWEDWEGSVSRNHYSPGTVCQWLYETVLGIHVDGENHFRIQPVPGGKMDYAKGHYKSLFGTVSSEWRKTGDGISYRFTVPDGCCASVELPDGRTAELKAGSYNM